MDLEKSVSHAFDAVPSGTVLHFTTVGHHLYFDQYRLFAKYRFVLKINVGYFMNRLF